MSNLIEQLNWRYATKKFDPSKKLTTEQLNTILDAGRLSASSFGLQPYVFVIVENPALRETLKANAWGQTQITDASYLIVLAARTNLDAAYVDHYVDIIAKERGISTDSLKNIREMMVGSVERMSADERTTWAKKQAYIALGFLLSACAHEQIDACPMEGFDAAKFDEVLELNKSNLTAAVVCTIGFRAADDEAATQKKVRFPKSELFDIRK